MELAFALLGVLLGLLTGLIPGMHPNNLAALAFLIPLAPMEVSLLLLSAAVAHTFANFIPSIFLGAPEDSTALAVLPGHEMLLEGKGMEALALTVAGGVCAVLFIILTIPIFSRAFPFLYDYIRPHMHIILAFLSVWIISRTGRWGLAVFGMAGLLGYLVLEAGALGSKGLLPMLAGLFGLPAMMLYSKTVVPPQAKEWTVGKRELLSGGILGSLAGMVVGMVPGIGSAQASSAIQEIVGKSKRMFLVSSGAINTAESIISVLALWLIGNPRSGVAVAIGNLMHVGLDEVLVFLSAIIMASSIAALASMKLGWRFSKLVARMNYRKISVAVASLIILAVLVSTGWKGLLVLGVSTSVGVLCLLKDVKRSVMMASIIVPAILFFASL